YERLGHAIEHSGTWAGHHINLRELVEELRKERAMNEHTWALFVGYFDDPGRCWRRELQDEKVLKQVVRISSWLSDLKELRSGCDVQQIAGA
ncbi:MAG: hypothetical protein NZ934_05135, partial [Hadesarchaea archaeon]|nr:hypothetical protein [Hadesarchaea archaeon]